MGKPPPRKLAVILHADVVGSTALVQRDEQIAHQRIGDAFALLSNVVAEYGGETHEIRGDALVAEFARASDAVCAALKFQSVNIERNDELADDVRPEVRVGIGMGEVVVAGGTVTGAGVVLAQRLEQLAEAAGVCIQGAVYETVPKRLPFDYDDLGRQTLKGFDEPVQAFAVRLKPGELIPAPARDEPASFPDSIPAKGLELPDKPSIAVLPFANMSGDPEQEYFADGITEDIITALSKFRWFFVIARNSSFVFKGQAVDLRQVGRELGVRYVLEGSVRRASNRVRITAQLIDAETGNHVWAERYERRLEDIFELQDEITSTIAAAIEPELAGSERKRALRKPTQHLGAWDLLQRGAALLLQHDRTSVINGLEIIRRAVELDSGFGEAYGYLAFGAHLLLVYEYTDEREAVLQQGLVDAERATALEPRDHFAYYALGRLKTSAGDYSAALRALETCVNLNPNFALGYLGLAEFHVRAGDPEAAVCNADKAIRLSPSDPMLWVMLHWKASAYVRLDEFDRAIELFEQICEFPSAQYAPSATLAALFSLQGQSAQAKKALERACRLEPKLSIELMKKVYGVTVERPGSRTQRLLDALRKAGLAEG